MTTAPKPSRTVESLVWGGLILVAAVIAILFAWSKLHSPPPLPVYNTVNAFALTNQNGQPVSQQDLRGKIWIADIIFTRCPTQCLRMSRQMSELQQALPADQSIRLVSLTADPVFDTPPILKKYGAPFAVRDDRWIFLTGEKRELYQLALNGLKLSVVENNAGDRASIEDLFIHSAKFALVDRQGRVRGWFDGDNPQSKQEILQALDSLRDEK